MEIIEVKDLSKNYGRIKALNSLNFSIRNKEVFGLLGPNGAGKSTLISILATISKPSSGDILVKGFSSIKQPQRIKPFIGFVPQDIALYTSLSGTDNLDFWASIYGLSGKLKKERIEEALSVVRLNERAKDRVDTYSGGMKRRLNIAVALLHHPEILVMDEPTAGVDIQSRRYIIDAVGKLRDEGRTVVFTSHYLDEMESLCDRIAIIETGTIDALGTLDELLNKYGAESLEDIMLNLNYG
ncbi:MAG TPA: ABC transporter ATP-binding protein [Clostridia bacterium]